MFLDGPFILVGRFKLFLFFSVWPLCFPGGTRGKELACQCGRLERFEFSPWVGNIPWRRKWQPAPVFWPENPMDRGPYWAAAHGVTKSRTRLKRQRIWPLSRVWLGCQWDFPGKNAGVGYYFRLQIFLIPGIFSTQVSNLRLLMVPAVQAGSLPGSPYQWIPLEVGLRWAQTFPLGRAVTTVTSKSTQRVWNIWFVKHYVVFRVKKLSFTRLPRHEIIYYRMKANV